MYNAFKSVIESKDFELGDMLDKIAKKRIQNKISEEEENELNELARANAKAENSYASVEVRIGNLYRELIEVKTRLYALENKDVSTEGTEQPTEPVDEYPEYIQPQGSHDCYKEGDRITFKGKKYICIMNGCVWTPERYPAGWEEVIEVTEDNVEV